jgi:hypothetical protein
MMRVHLMNGCHEQYEAALDAPGPVAWLRRALWGRLTLLFAGSGEGHWTRDR